MNQKIWITADDSEQERFQAAVLSSNVATLMVMRWLWNNTSWWIKAKPAKPHRVGHAPTDENTAADIYISRDGVDWRLIEVKHRGLDFRGRNDYPYPTIFLDRVKPVDPADWYFILSAGMTHLAIVSSDVPREKITINDRGKAGVPYEVWQCQKIHPEIRWVNLTSSSPA